MLALQGGGDWLDRTLRIPRRPPGLAPPPDEVPAPQIIGRPSEVEPLLERAGQRAAEVERQAAQDIESFASQQLAEAEASEGFATAAEAAAGAARRLRRRRREVAPWRCWAKEPWRRREPWVRRREAWRWREQVLLSSARRGPYRRAQRGFASDGLGRCNRRRHGQRRLAAEHDHGRADPERDARKRSRRSLLHPGAAEGPAAGGLQDRHGVGERAQESAAATDPKPPGTAPEAPGADPFRPEQRSHPRVLRQRTVPGQPPVPRRPGTPWNPAVLRGATSGERTGSCVSM